MAENNKATLRIIASRDLPPQSLSLHPGEELLPDKLLSLPEGCDLVVVSYTHWQEAFDTCEDLLSQLPSTLILNLK